MDQDQWTLGVAYLLKNIRTWFRNFYEDVHPVTQII